MVPGALGTKWALGSHTYNGAPQAGQLGWYKVTHISSADAQLMHKQLKTVLSHGFLLESAGTGPKWLGNDSKLANIPVDAQGTVLDVSRWLKSLHWHTTCHKRTSNDTRPSWSPSTPTLWLAKRHFVSCRVSKYDKLRGIPDKRTLHYITLRLQFA